MASPKRGWLTPDSPVSPELECRAFYIPNQIEFIGAVSGALLELTKAYNWEKFGTMTAEEAAGEMYNRWLAFMENSCGSFECPPGYRIDQYGKLQQSNDGGGSWTDNPNAIFIETPEREEPTAEERRCLAAANAVEVLRLTYLDVLVAFAEDRDATFGMLAFATIMAFLLGALFYPASGLAALSALLNFTLGAFSTAYAGLEFLGDDDWTPDYSDELTCLLYEHSSDVEGVVSFDWVAVTQNIFMPEFDAALTFWNWYVLNVIGEQGLNDAGATTSIDEWDCSDCLLWCYNWDFTTGTSDWEVRDAGEGDYNSGIGWEAACIGGTAKRVVLELPFPSGAVMTQFTGVVEYSPGSAGGGADPRGVFMRILNSAGDVIEQEVSTIPLPTGIHEVGVNYTGTPATLQINIWTSNVACDGYAIIPSLTVRGTGINPFGENNCPE